MCNKLYFPIAGMDIQYMIATKKHCFLDMQPYITLPNVDQKNKRAQYLTGKPCTHRPSSTGSKRVK